MRWLYDPEKIKQGIASGETAINELGDPLSKMEEIHAWLGELYNWVCKQTIIPGVPAHQNCGQQEKEIIQHFREIWDDKQYDVNCLPTSVDDPDNLFIRDEPYISGAAALYHSDPKTEKIDYLEEDDQEEVSMIIQDSDAYSESKDDGTATVQESTDTEIREGTASMMISSDRD